MRPEILNFLFCPIKNFTGVGEKAIEKYIKLLSKKRQFLNQNRTPKALDLLFHLPDKIQNRKFINNINDANDGDFIVAKIKVLSHSTPSNTKQPYIINCYLGNNFISIVYYKYFENYINNKFPIDKEIFVSGKFEIYNSKVQIVHPDFICNNISEIPVLESIYPLTNGLTNKEIAKNIDYILKNIPDLPEWLDEQIIKQNNWKSWKESLLSLHKPKYLFDTKDNIYIKRLAFDEILAQQLALIIVKSNGVKQNTKQELKNNRRELKNNFINNILNFQLTKDQINVLQEIENDTFSNKRMMRLLQGDVGSGKTIVAFILMLNYIENKKQCVLMAPTSILAFQHYENLKIYCNKLNLKIELLTGKIKGKKRNEIFEKLKSGEINILIGTHAIIEDNVEFYDLAFAAIDEQHRFGVEQRLMLINKNTNTDILAMSATPIPRTLALTVYNDMELSIIKEKPKNRKEIITSIITMDKYNDLILRIKEKIKNNEKIYWICPLVEESDKIDVADVINKNKEFCEIFGEENVAFIHGKMKEKEKDSIMEDFCNNDGKKILIATTVIEVGIDIKDATIIVIEHPERFGLSQLHQLRGRVGRGDKQSYCILLHNTKNYGKNTMRRLSIMRGTTNGFTIAEEDLKIRGIGEVMGVKQSGQQDYIISDIDRDFGLLEQAMFYTQKIIKENMINDFVMLLYLFGYTGYLRQEVLN